VKDKFIVIVAGEASADLHGSNLVRAIKFLHPSAVFHGIGGSMMKEAGVHILYPSSELAVVGITEVFSRLKTIIKAAGALKNLLRRHRPDLLILLDFPDFNLHIAGVARKAEVPVLYYISPQVWAWRKGRIRKISRRVDRMAVILPFEEDFYRRRGVQVDFVGHPLMDYSPSRNERGVKKKRGDPHVLALVPGSRREEIRNLLPMMIRASCILKALYPDMQFRLPLAPTIDPDFLAPYVRSSPVEIGITQGGIHSVLRSCDAAVVASGTATLETAMNGVPMVIVYRVSPISYRVARLLIKVDQIGLVNWVAGEKVVPELIQGQVTPHGIAREVTLLLEDDSVRKKMVRGLEKVRERLGRGGASAKTARIALELMGISASEFPQGLAGKEGFSPFEGMVNEYGKDHSHCR
jgi:lipid-A-disaccharide synthase